MSELSPELKQVIAATRESVCPDEQAIAALRAALDARIARAAAGDSLDISDAPLDFGTTVTRGVLVKLFGSLFAIAAIGGMLWLAVEARTEPPLALPRAVPAPDQASHELASPAVTAPPPVASTATAADAPRVPPLRRKRIERNPRRALPVEPALPQSTSKPAQPVAVSADDGRANEPRPDVEDPLVQELNVLHAALAALDRGAAAQAVALLDQHDLRYPHGPLRQERLATRVLALCALGRAPEAHATASQLLQLAPRVPYLARLRRSCVAEVVK